MAEVDMQETTEESLEGEETNQKKNPGSGDAEEVDASSASSKASGRQGKSVAAVLGEITWLLTQGQAYRYSLFIADLEWLVMPALQHGQYRLFLRDNKPAGVALWAYVSDRADSRLRNGGRLAVNEWRSGPHLWLVDLIAPFGGQEAMLRDLRGSVFKGQAFRLLRTNADGKREPVQIPGESEQHTAASVDENESSESGPEQ